MRQSDWVREAPLLFRPALLLAAALVIASVVVRSVPAFAQSRNIDVLPHTPEKRVALVIGNDAYRHVRRLERAVSDARAIGAELRTVGFEVLPRANLDRRGMNQAVNALVDRVSGGGVAVLFFAGHGVQVSGANFLLPVDVNLTRAEDLEDEALELGRVMERLASARAKFVLLIVDACRDNPFPKVAARSVGAARGLTIPAAPDGLMVVYSAGINEQALDKLSDRDTDPNGLFTREFVKQLRVPGVRVDDMVRRVRSEVRKKAREIGHAQNPAIYDQSDGDFYFTGATVATVASPSVPTRPVGSNAQEPEQKRADDAIRIAKLSPEAARDRIKEKFLQDGLARITVEVDRDGVLILKGAVPKEQKSRAVEIANGFGIRVKDRIFEIE
jgi:hypothetical protein